jgi:xanthine dehydrogenase YagR molybdenum-binding subunit
VSVLQTVSVGTSLTRRDGVAKVRGQATYAAEHQFERPTHMHPIQATIARGTIRSIDASAAVEMDGVVAVLTHENAPRLASADDQELWILQNDEVAFRGQLIGAVIAESSEVAREAAASVLVSYNQQPYDVVLRADHPDLYAPEKVNPSFPTDTSDGDVDEAMRNAPVTVDQSYSTPMEHNNPMEPHTTTAIYDGSSLTLYDSTQAVHSVRSTIAPLFGLDPEQVHVISPFVGGGFGSKGNAHAHIVLAGLGALSVNGRPVKLALTRQQMFALVGYRTPTIQRIRLGADDDGRLQAISHEVIEQTSRIKEFAEQTAVATRMMYAAPNRLTSHRLAPLDVAVPSWMRAPGESPGMFAPEVALDELAERCGLDPIELRIRNEPETDPETGNPWSTRRLVECLQAGAERFGWEQRDSTPASVSRKGWLIGIGVASSTYPVNAIPGSVARISFGDDGIYTASIGSADIGQGTWTSLAQIAADALSVPVEQVEMQIGDTALPFASVAGGSSGITSWGSAIVAAAEKFREQFGEDPSAGDHVEAQAAENEDTEHYAMHAFGAQFAEVHVHADTGEIRVARMLGMFDAGRIINPLLARSQFIGGMTMGLSMALHENSVVDPRFGHVVTHDFADYHIPVNADIREIEAHWLDGNDPHTNPMGSKGIGEIGIVGAAAAIANATYNATGIRVRDLPITADKLLPQP